jgi:hypothetical protein
MEQRKEPRVKPEMAVRASGIDPDGKIFSQLVKVCDVSKGGARLQGVRHVMLVGGTVTLQYQGKKADFRVVRVGIEQGHRQAEVALQILPSQPDIWDVHTKDLTAALESS